MRFAFPPLTPAVRTILVVLFASLVAQSVAEPLLGLPLFRWLALHDEFAFTLLWQWASYVLVEYPGDRMVLSRALDLLLIYFWLTPFEKQFGARRTFTLAALSAVAGAVLPLVVGLLAPEISVPHAGASAISWAGLAALAVTTRGQPMNWVLLPQMNAWTLAAIFLVFTALQCAWMGTPTPLLGVLGGFAAGVLYTRRLERSKRRRAPPKPRGGHLQIISGGQAESGRPRWLN
jgi:membrane associated rhomboid family serine protease